MAPTLHVLGLALQTYPVFVLLAASLGLWLAARGARQLGLDEDAVYSLGFYALLATALGARLAYVLGHWAAYRGTPLAILSPTTTALSWPEGAVIGGLAGLIYWHYRRLPVGRTLDALAPGLALALAVERAGAFLAGNGLGERTVLPWGVYAGSQLRHPIQLYEAAALLGIVAVLWWRRGRRPFDGHSFVLLVATYAGTRLFLEAFRAQAPLLGGVRTVQVIALLVMLGAVGYLYSRRFPAGARAPAAAQQEEEREQLA
jgi:phosphatidylglycerol:prolipoprotein diacylglycerol transferase